MSENFSSLFPASYNCTVAPDALIDKYSAKLPAYLIDLWKSSGLGKYRDGLIELVNPEDYEEVLQTWLGKANANYVPFAISAFGELFYYRKLTETDEDVCMIDIQYRKIDVLTWDLTAFFEDYLVDDYNRDFWLREKLFNEAISKNGKLENSEVYTFVPVLAFGGAEDIEYLQKGKADVYQHLVFSMTA